ncbi:hypothetical protein CA850_05470 [Micromonospora echinospora]|uniref:Uncharacterized protein n=1 Tax=Micromonospora echinospora TaxID=1877 RepID=A0A1C4UZU4_MICEC|nr:hypothetical protein [Micromonospora echinospora]OZV82961.1 hypothetical protein CA850_05470 [Micromonospora echinospora]SCE77176.1 hypothetical protein GA0070618_0806 [Micromonospora echinospora]
MEDAARNNRAAEDTAPNNRAVEDAARNNRPAEDTAPNNRSAEDAAPGDRYRRAHDLLRAAPYEPTEATGRSTGTATRCAVPSTTGGDEESDGGPA